MSCEKTHLTLFFKNKIDIYSVKCLHRVEGYMLKLVFPWLALSRLCSFYTYANLLGKISTTSSKL